MYVHAIVHAHVHVHYMYMYMYAHTKSDRCQHSEHDNFYDVIAMATTHIVC